MKVILLQDVKNVGKKDDIVEVSQGYGANFLIKKGLAVMFTNHSRDVLNKQQQIRADEEEKRKQQAKEVVEQLKSITLEFTAQSAKDGRMIGTISTKQICEEMMAKYKIEIDKRKFVDKFPVNAFGFTRLKIEIYKGIVGIVNVHVSEKK